VESCSDLVSSLVSSLVSGLVEGGADFDTGSGFGFDSGSGSGSGSAMRVVNDHASNATALLSCGAVASCRINGTDCSKSPCTNNTNTVIIQKDDEDEGENENDSVNRDLSMA
jgi:hypothetical protein